MCNTQELYLDGNQISDDGFATLIPLLNKDGKLSGLTGFGIGSGITDKGMKEFTDILSMGAWLGRREVRRLASAEAAEVQCTWEKT